MKLTFSFTKTNQQKVDTGSSVKAYKVVMSQLNADGSTKICDIKTGKVYYCGSTQNRRAKKALLHDTKAGAIKESSKESRKLFGLTFGKTHNVQKRSKVVACFDAWGERSRRLGGDGAAIYDHVRFISVVQNMGPLDTMPKSRSDYCVEPHFFPKQDRFGDQFSAVGV